MSEDCSEKAWEVECALAEYDHLVEHFTQSGSFSWLDLGTLCGLAAQRQRLNGWVYRDAFLNSDPKKATGFCPRCVEILRNTPEISRVRWMVF